MTLDQIGLDAVYNAAYAAEVNRDFKRAVEAQGGERHGILKRLAPITCDVILVEARVLHFEWA